MNASQAQMTFISRYLELPQLVEDSLYDEMTEHSEREGGSERAELKYYSSMTTDETHYNLDIAGLDADADGMHAMRYLWTEMRQLIDQDHFSLPIDELCSANLKLSDVITKTEVAVLGWFSNSGIVVIRAAAADGSSTTLYVMRSMSDERLEIQKELTLDARPVLDLSPDGLLIYADGSTQLTLWNLAANEKDVLDSSSCHGPEGVTCVKYVASTSHLLYAFSASAASVWDVKSRTLVKAVPWQMASPVTSVAIADNWLIVGLDNGNVSLYAAWKHLSSIALQGTVSSICVGKVEGESIKFSCIHKGQPSASIAFLTWSPEATWNP